MTQPAYNYYEMAGMDLIHKTPPAPHFPDQDTTFHANTSSSDNMSKKIPERIDVSSAKHGNFH